MREIKFRALYKDGTWRYGEYPHLAPEMSNTVSPLHIFWQTRLMELQMHTLGQYTGLKDKNGTEVFEGDIVTHTTIKRVYRVLFMSGRFVVNDPSCCEVCKRGTACHGDLYELVTSGGETEIIGNIWQNPELLP